ncbi:MAG TPA: tyrosine-type recombinase/integrase [Actinokineospora sp.]|nr:tyrosine-type recombinase/integrase [Actinokineospora sp.]
MPKFVPSPGDQTTAPNLDGRSYRHGTLTAYNAGRCRCGACRDAYADYRAHRRANGKDRPPITPTDDSPSERHLSRHWFRRRIWKPDLATAGITHRARIHDLRHAHASWLLQGGADLQTVRERLGHASLRTLPSHRPGTARHSPRRPRTNPPHKQTSTPAQPPRRRGQWRQPGHQTVKRSRQIRTPTSRDPATLSANRTVTRRSRDPGNAERPFDVNHRKAV